jgi:hypothetical protein
VNVGNGDDSRGGRILRYTIGRRNERRGRASGKGENPSEMS